MTQPQGPLPPTRRSPETNDFPTGPAIGELLPDFTLPNQNGGMVNFTAARQGKKAMVVFSRSARW
jgi:hypothetical protein